MMSRSRAPRSGGGLRPFATFGLAAAFTVLAGFAQTSFALQTMLDGCSSQNFPFVFVSLRVADDNGAPLENLFQSDFGCTENTVGQDDGFAMTRPMEGGGVRLADVVILIDTSGSMAAELAAVKGNVESFAAALAASGIDFRLGLVRFGNGAGPNPDLLNNGNLISDVGEFQQLVAPLAEGGGLEPGFEALRLATEGFAFRPGAQKVFILITDEDSDDPQSQGSEPSTELEKTTTLDLLAANDVTVHVAVDCTVDEAESHYCDATSVRAATGGLQFSVTDPLDAVLDTIVDRTAGTYILRYRSSNPSLDATERTVVCTATDGVSIADVTCTYVPGAAPQIVLTPDTVALNQSSVTAGATPTIGAIVTDLAAPFVQDVTLYFRVPGNGDSEYTASPMTAVGGDVYELVLPAVGPPRIDYYVRASDGQVSSSLPSVDPAAFPFQIAVLPNVAPQISHTPVTEALPGTEIGIGAEVVDTTNVVALVELRWRRAGELIFQVLPLQNTGGDSFAVSIPPAEVTDDIEYFVRAVDDFGVASMFATPDSPQIIHVAKCGDDTVNAPGEECDGQDDGACPARCEDDCTCGTCATLAPRDAAGDAKLRCLAGRDCTLHALLESNGLSIGAVSARPGSDVAFTCSPTCNAGPAASDDATCFINGGTCAFSALELAPNPGGNPPIKAFEDGAVAEVTVQCSGDSTGEICLQSVSIGGTDGSEQDSCGEECVPFECALCDPGDCNTNGSIDAGDPICIVLCMIGEPAAASNCGCYSDCNCIGGTEISDPVCAVLRLVGSFAPDTCASGARSLPADSSLPASRVRVSHSAPKSLRRGDGAKSSVRLRGQGVDSVAAIKVAIETDGAIAKVRLPRRLRREGYTLRLNSSGSVTEVIVMAPLRVPVEPVGRGRIAIVKTSAASPTIRASMLEAASVTGVPLAVHH